MTDDRFEAIETKLAHQEALLADLNEALVKQQDSIMRLEALCESLRLRVRSLGDALPADAPQDERPPHY
ncbi:MAG: SlyX family protein [Woeseiaceae bacterium]|nr:SlyX family protein [Woeseiaceae bacterium]